MWLWSSSRRATTWITSLSGSRWTIPCTAISRAPITILRCFSNTSGQTTRLAMPVSSSMVMKHDALGAARPLADQHQPGDRQALAVPDRSCSWSAVTNFCAA